MSAQIPPLSASLAAAGAMPAGLGTTGKKYTDEQTKPKDPGPPQDPQPRVEPPPQQPMLAADLRIEVDKAAGRFVLTFTDPETGETLRRFPNEAQLAFARIINTPSGSVLDVET
jgi:hypothetical protein